MRSLLLVAVLSMAWSPGAASQTGRPAAVSKAVRLTGWVSDGHCGAKHMSPGGEACVRKCIAGATHLNPEWKPGGMVFVSDDKRVFKVDNPDVLWDHAGRHVAVSVVVDTEKTSIRALAVEPVK